MARILRGEIWRAYTSHVKRGMKTQTRPVLVISHDVFNAKSGTVIAFAITSQAPRAGFPLTYPVKSLKMPKPSWVKMSQVRTISTERLGKRLGRLSADELSEILEGFAELIG